MFPYYSKLRGLYNDFMSYSQYFLYLLMYLNVEFHTDVKLLYWIFSFYVVKHLHIPIHDVCFLDMRSNSLLYKYMHNNHHRQNSKIIFFLFKHIFWTPNSIIIIYSILTQICECAVLYIWHLHFLKLYLFVNLECNFLFIF